MKAKQSSGLNLGECEFFCRPSQAENVKHVLKVGVRKTRIGVPSPNAFLELISLTKPWSN